MRINHTRHIPRAPFDANLQPPRQRAGPIIYFAAGTERIRQWRNITFAVVHSRALQSGCRSCGVMFAPSLAARPHFDKRQRSRCPANSECKSTSERELHGGPSVWERVNSLVCLTLCAPSCLVFYSFASQCRPSHYVHPGPNRRNSCHALPSHQDQVDRERRCLCHSIVAT